MISICDCKINGHPPETMVVLLASHLGNQEGWVKLQTSLKFDHASEER